MAVNLKVEVEVVKTLQQSCSEPSSRLVEVIVDYFTQAYGLPKICPHIRSEVPSGSGLKSSSAVAVALIRSIAEAFRVEGLEVPRLAAELSRWAGVSVTGALDDAAASYYGGIALTDNLNMRVIDLRDCPLDINVVLLIDEPRREVDVNALRRWSPTFLKAFELAYSGEVFKAMTLNGMAVAKILGYNTEPLERALVMGALAAGVSGNGPAKFAICREGDEGPFVDLFARYGTVVVVKPTRLGGGRP